MSVQLGKRYRDRQTGIEILVIKPGTCEMEVDGRPMDPMFGAGPAGAGVPARLPPNGPQSGAQMAEFEL
jgi:hypothetical protein